MTFSKMFLKVLIAENFTPANGKFFFSIEVTPKSGLNINFNDFKILPLFVDITWVKDENLKTSIKISPAFELAREIKSARVVNTITCYNLTDDHIAQILSNPEPSKNYTILRGGENDQFNVLRT